MGCIPRVPVAHGPASPTLPAWLQRGGRRTTSRSLLCASAHPPRTPWISPCRPRSPAPPGHDCSQRCTKLTPCVVPAVVPRCGSSPSLPIPSRSSGSSATSSRPARLPRDSTPLLWVDSPPPPFPRAPDSCSRMSRATLVWTAIAFSTPLRQHGASPRRFPHSQLHSLCFSSGRTPVWTPAKPPSGAIIVTTIRPRSGAPQLPAPGGLQGPGPGGPGDGR